MELGKVIPHFILITPCDNKGFLVTIGCAKFVYTDITALVMDLKDYLQDPLPVEKAYNKACGADMCEKRGDRKDQGSS
jgi:hypothetical protein